MIKRILILSITFITGIALGWFANAFSNDESFRTSHLSSLSISLSGDFKVIKALKKKGVFEPDIKSYYDEKFTKLVFSLMVINSNFQGLSASNTEPWCNLIQYHIENTISFDESLDEIVDAYVTKIKPAIDSEIADAQQHFGGDGCEIGEAS
ncbi:hypothetical protein QTP81_16930 [Alteromonas sp. ASW11-36]|uniref:Uncharacterized protein n=1 Tax=Alteromonas arenosi TaxID=3055817 RepID=A0ABT7T239_9ALTE|nr:hypothetical protein [Alteromonas sp. ASW11-36]MDM7862294.1 hypothetical protein [Alteromonas sp. ASW11-36]